MSIKRIALIVAFLLWALPAWAITFPNAATTSVGTAATSVPTGTVNGDLLIAACVLTSSGQDINIAGWTDVPNCGVAAASSPGLSINYRIASSEPGSYTFANIASSSFCAMLDYHGTNASTPIEISNVATGTSTTATAPSLTTTVSGDWLVSLYSFCDTFVSGPAGETSRASNTSCGSQWAGWFGDVVLGGTGATGTKVLTLSTSAFNWSACNIAIEPVAGTHSSQLKGATQVKGSAQIQ